jgi:4-hydroxy-2-oxoglutarate aldolase
MLLEGIFPAMTTPFYPDGRCYFRKLEHNVVRYSQTPIAGMVVLGSTGEAIMLSDDETRDVLQAAVQAAAEEKVMIAGVGHESMAETLRLAEFAAEAMYDAVLVRTPHYYGPQMGAAEILTYYRSLADRSPLPVVIYNIPKFSHYDLSVELAADLAQHPNIIAIKDSTGSTERIRALVEATRDVAKRTVDVTPVFTAVTERMRKAAAAPEPNMVPASALGGAAVQVAEPQTRMKTRTKEVGFQVLTGAPNVLLEALDAGATGGIMALASCVPQACQELYWAWKDNDRALAEEKQKRLIEPNAVVAGKYGVPGIKYGCDLNGYFGGRPRIPLLPVDADGQEEIARVLEDLKH